MASKKRRDRKRYAARRQAERQQVRSPGPDPVEQSPESREELAAVGPPDEDWGGETEAPAGPRPGGSTAERKPAILIGGCAILLFVIIGGAFAVEIAGQRRERRERIAAEASKLEQLEQRFQDERKEIEQAIESEPRLFPQPVAAPIRDRLSEAANRLDDAGEELDRLSGNGNSAGADELNSTLARVSSMNADVRGALASAREAVDVRLAFKSDSDQRSRMKEAHEDVAAIDLERLSGVVDQAAEDWPEKASDLRTRLEELRAMVARAQDDWDQLQAAYQAIDGDGETSAELDEAIRRVDRLRLAEQAAPTRAQEISDLIGQLYHSWDEILVDMQIVEGYSVNFRHKIKRVEATLDGPGIDPEPAAPTSEEGIWSPVSESRYRQLEDKLGMSIRRKPAGKYDNEIEGIPQPQGYAYVSPPSQERNRYGYWDSRRGGTVWVWHDRGPRMGRVLYGPDNSDTITPVDYETYRTKQSENQTYYGKKTESAPARYGSQCTFAKSTYADSNYVKTNGYASSRYKRSGGTFRGGKYQTAAGSTPRTNPAANRGSNRPRSSGGWSFFGGRSGGSRSYGGGSRFGGGGK